MSATCYKMQVVHKGSYMPFFRKIDVDDMIDLGEMTLGQGHDITTHFNVTSTPCALYV